MACIIDLMAEGLTRFSFSALSYNHEDAAG